MRRTSALLLAAALCLLLAGCYNIFGTRRTDRSSSIVDYLYPNKANPVDEPTMPVLSLPLRVGIAFVPSRGRPSDFSEAQKQLLLEKVAAEFKNRPFVRSIETIPSTYLRPGGGFDNLDQVRRLLGVDVVVLLAYDQMQFTDANLLSLSYWTIVGAYVFKGDRNDTQTLLEAAVYDIPSRSLLFRAPGVDLTHSSSAAMYTSEQRRSDGAHSIALATDDLVKNLTTALDNFRTEVKKGTARVKVVNQPGYTGGGALEAWFALALAGLALLGMRTRRP